MILKLILSQGWCYQIKALETTEKGKKITWYDFINSLNKYIYTTQKLEMKFPKNIMYTAPFAFLQPHNQIFFQVPSRIFGKNFVCCLLMLFTINTQNFSLEFMLGTWKKIWLWGWRKANGAVHMIFSRNIISKVGSNK